MRIIIWGFSLLLVAHSAFADVALTDRRSAERIIGQAVERLTPEQKQALRDANKAKRDAKKAKRKTNGRGVTTDSPRPVTNATGSVQLIDAGTLQYFINTDITFSTSSSASGAASEASFTGPIAVTTSAGGVIASTLSDMFDGYNGLCVSLTNATGPCATGNANYTMYEKNGPAVVDASVPAVAECTNRQYVLPAQTIGGLSVQRKVYVPTNDRFIRWANFYTNTSGAPITFTTITSNNLGSDSNTRIVSSSSGDNVAQVGDLWVSTFQNYSGSTSTDPRIAHVLQGTGAPTPVSNINFADGDDNPYWVYAITLAPGQTKMILNFASGLGSKAAANAQGAALAALPVTTTQCLSATELSQVTNFAVATDLSITKTASVVTNVNAGQAYQYTLQVTNNGPAVASSLTVTDTLPAGVVFGSATGTGWTCNAVLQTVTCTLPTLALGAANPITINVTAPVAAGPLSNTATVSSTTTETNPGNNTSTNDLTVIGVANLSITKTTTATTAQEGVALTYTLSVSNTGPSAATNVSVSDPLPAGTAFQSASGTGWTCANLANVVTCTRPTLAVGAAPPISLRVVPIVGTGTITNTATVSTSEVDSTPANNASTVALAASAAVEIPALDPKGLALLLAFLAVAAVFAIHRHG
ncbi:MAG: DUF11 domain-containing protein [Acidobacteriota bacterium]